MPGNQSLLSLIAALANTSGHVSIQDGLLAMPDGTTFNVKALHASLSDPGVSGSELRNKAAELLVLAQGVDKLSPYLITYEHENGAGAQLKWFDKEPTVEDAADCLIVEFEPERGERLTIEPVRLWDLCMSTA